MKIGMKPGHYRDPEFARKIQCRTTQWSFGHDVHQIGRRVPPVLRQNASRRKADLQIAITGYRAACYQHPFRSGRGQSFIGLLLQRPHQLNLMPARQ
jgi:hypothetical protein